MKELLIKNATIITMNDDNDVIENGFIFIKDKKILDLGKTDDCKYNSSNQIDASDKIIIPGLINAHTHASMSLLRGYADDYPLKIWLENYIWPAEAKYMNKQNIILGAQLAILEMLQSGTTFFNDMYFYEDEIAKVVKKAGIKAYLCEGIIDYPIKSYDVQTKFDKIINLKKEYPTDDLVYVGIAPHSPYTCTKSTLLKAKQIADDFDMIYHIHVAETENEYKQIPDNNLSPVQFLNNLNLIDDKFTAIHCVYLNDKDRDILKEKNAGIVHNPVSNKKLASGIADVYKMMKKGLKVGLGTDGATSNNNLDMFKEMSHVALTQKAISKNPETLSAEQTLYLATKGSAKVLHVDDITGSLEAGKYADLVILNPNNPHSLPWYNPFSYIVYSAKSTDVETTIINGKIVYDKGTFFTLDKDKILSEAKNFAENIKNA